MQKVYVSDEEKEKIMDKLNKDTEVRNEEIHTDIVFSHSILVDLSSLCSFWCV